MSTPRLLFLYPPLFRSAGIRGSRGPRKALQRRGDATATPRSTFTTTATHQQEAFPQRYGSAQEPRLPPPDKIDGQIPSSSSLDKDQTLAGTIEQEVKKTAQLEAPKAETVKKKEPKVKSAKDTKEQATAASIKKADEEEETKKPAAPSPIGPMEDRGKAIEFANQDPKDRIRQLDATPSPSPPPSSDSSTSSTTPPPAADPMPLSSVMAMPGPCVDSKDVAEASSSFASQQHPRKPHHFTTPPYVHHFDTYTLVQNLENGGFGPKQSEAIMKGMRSLLGSNLDVAQDGLVSKGDVENETYLFRAACSELRTEILNLRRLSSTKSKSQLAHLQHTADLLSQRSNSELASLRDDLKGMLNDRRMDNRQASQSHEARIQEIGFLVGTRLGGDAKSGVEGLRWVMTRRASMAFLYLVVCVVGTIWYGSVVVHERERREKVEGERVERERRESANGREMGTQTEGLGEEGGLAVRGKGGKGDVSDLGYASLG